MMEKLRDMLCDELDEITRKGELSDRSLDEIDKLTHSIKSIDAIMAMEDGKYGRGRRNARRDSMGRYASDGEWSNRLHEMERNAPSEYSRGEIRDYYSRER